MNPLPKEITIGDKYGPAMEITDQDEADAYFQICVDHCMVHFDRERGEAESIERQNLGYFSGYYGAEVRERVERLFHCSHPVFGSIAVNGSPTLEEALEAGRKLGETS